MNFLAAKDVFHQQVRQALEKDGWAITADPLSLRWLGTILQIDLGAEQLIAAERGEERHPGLQCGSGGGGAMDKLEHYRDIIERELTAIVEQAEDSTIGPAGLRDKTVFDRYSPDPMKLMVALISPVGRVLPAEGI